MTQHISSISAGVSRAAYLPPPPRDETPICPRCKFPLRTETDHGWLDVRRPGSLYARVVPCPACTPGSEQRRRAKEVARLMGAAHLPYYAESWSFDTTPDDLDSRAAAHARIFADLRTIKRGLYLFGETGAGKTSLVISIIKRAMWRQEDAMFIRECDLVERLRAAVARQSEDGDDLLAIARSVRWLAIDELGLTKPTPFVLELLYKLIEARRAGGLYTAFTSNYNLAQLEAFWRPAGIAAGSFHPGRRITERLAEYCDGVKVDSKNLRRRS